MDILFYFALLFSIIGGIALVRYLCKRRIANYKDDEHEDSSSDYTIVR